jgi:hypothetical protein
MDASDIGGTSRIPKEVFLSGLSKEAAHVDGEAPFKSRRILDQNSYELPLFRGSRVVVLLNGPWNELNACCCGALANESVERTMEAASAIVVTLTRLLVRDRHARLSEKQGARIYSAVGHERPSRDDISGDNRNDVGARKHKGDTLP